MNKYPEVFQGEVGRLEEKLKVEVDTVQAVRLPVSRILLSVKSRIEKGAGPFRENGHYPEGRQDHRLDIQFGCCAYKPNGKLRVCSDPTL